MKILALDRSNSQECHKTQSLPHSLNNAFLLEPEAKARLMAFRKEQCFQKVGKYDDLLNATHHYCHCHHSPYSSTACHTHIHTRIYFMLSLLARLLSEGHVDRCYSYSNFPASLVCHTNQVIWGHSVSKDFLDFPKP